MKKYTAVFACLVLLWAAAAFALAEAAVEPAESELYVYRSYESGSGAAYGSNGVVELASHIFECRLAEAKTSPAEPEPVNI